MAVTPTPVVEDIWTLDYPMKVLGLPLNRRVTLIKLPGGRLLIHSTAPFTVDDRRMIETLGEPFAICDVTAFHDTYAVEGRDCFRTVPYFAPRQMSQRVREQTGARPMADLVGELPDEVEVFPLLGQPKVGEHLFYHVPTETLIVADLLFNLDPPPTGLAHTLLSTVAGMKEYPAVDRLVRMLIRDREAFRVSLRPVLMRPIARIIPAHGAVIEGPALEHAMTHLRVL